MQAIVQNYVHEISKAVVNDFFHKFSEKLPIRPGIVPLHKIMKFERLFKKCNKSNENE